MSCRTPRRTTYKKISHPTCGKMRHFWEKHAFLNFSQFLQKYRISVYISIHWAPNEASPISIDPEGVAGNYGVSTFFASYQVDELRNQKCKTHIENLAAMKFRNLEKLSYRLNHLKRTYLKKKLKLGQSSKIESSWNFFLFFYLLKKKLSRLQEIQKSNSSF